MLLTFILSDELVNVDVFASFVSNKHLSIEVFHVYLASAKLIVVLTDFQKLDFA